MRVLPEEIYLLQRTGNSQFPGEKLEFLRVYNILFELVFSLGGAFEWSQGEFHFMGKQKWKGLWSGALLDWIYTSWAVIITELGTVEGRRPSGREHLPLACGGSPGMAKRKSRCLVTHVEKAKAWQALRRKHCKILKCQAHSSSSHDFSVMGWWVQSE